MNYEEDMDCFRYKFHLDRASYDVPENSEGGNLKRVSPDYTAGFENAEMSQTKSTFEFEEEDKEVAGTQRSTTAPGRPRTTDIGISSINIEWEKPSERDILYYEIRFKKVSDNIWCRPVFSDYDKPCYQVRSLEADTEYEFKVRAHYKDKEGDFSQRSDISKTKPTVVEEETPACKTLTLKPGKPVALDVHDDHIQLGWDKPKEKNVKYYEIKFKSSENSHWLKPVFTENANTFYRINNLVPDIEYTFKVRPHFETFEGTFSDDSDSVKTNKLEQANVVDTPTASSPSRPGKPAALGVGCDYACIAWDKPDKPGVDYYEVKMKTAEGGSWFKQPSFTEGNKPYKKICGLACGTEYEFKVRGHYQEDEGEFSEKSDPVKTTQPSMHALSLRSISAAKDKPSRKPGKPCAIAVGGDYIDLNWDKPGEKHVTCYELKTKLYNREAWNKMPVFTEDAKTFCRMSSLALSTQYVFKVRAHFLEEEGEFSNTSDVITTLNTLDNTDDDTRLVMGQFDTKEKVSYGRSSPEHLHNTKVMLRDVSGNPKNDLTLEPEIGGVLEPHYQRITEPNLPTGTQIFYTQEDGSLIQNVFPRNPQIAGRSPTDRPPAQNIMESSIGTHRKNSTLEPGMGDEFGSHFKGNRELNVQPGTQMFCTREDGGLLQSVFPGISHTAAGLTKDSLQEQNIKDNGCGSQNIHARRPSKPTVSKTGSDFIILDWAIQESSGVLYYEIKYRLTNDELWIRDSITTKDSSPQVSVHGLLQDTGYTFKVRAHYRDEESNFSEPSDPIYTKQSPARSFRDKCFKLQDGEPAFYKLPLKENKAARNRKYKTRKCEFGSSHVLEEKTILMIGATGSGKSTLIDGMVNHLLGVKWDDDFRFKIIDLMSDEEAKKGRETESQTDWITSYRVHPMIETVQYICNIIDTPGFGDTRGIERDHGLVDQIRAFFDTKGDQGIQTIDAICFVTQAPLARLTHTQRYIYESILSIFGKDMQDNIVAMITFADGKEPPVLNALVQAEIPIKKHFVFNNSALFEPNTEGNCNKFGKMFWDMGFLSNGAFFNFLPSMKRQSLQLTAGVLKTREELNVTIQGLLPQIDMALCDLATMQKERDLVNQYSREIADNKNFTYEADEYHQNKLSLNPGEYVTNCTFCNYTCHYPCRIPEDSNKEHCASMNNGLCTVCPSKCEWTSHRNNDFRIQVTLVKVKKTYEEMKRKFEFAEKSKVSKENLLQRIVKKISKLKDSVCHMIDVVRNCGNYLRQNAIRSNPLTEIEYLDVLIQSEKQQKQPGFQSRIDMLEVFKRSAKIKAKSVHMKTEDFLKDLGWEEIDM